MKADARSDEGREIGDEPVNSRVLLQKSQAASHAIAFSDGVSLLREPDALCGLHIYVAPGWYGIDFIGSRTRPTPHKRLPTAGSGASTLVLIGTPFPQFSAKSVNSYMTGPSLPPPDSTSMEFAYVVFADTRRLVTRDLQAQRHINVEAT